MTTTLYDYWRSSASYRTRIALHMLGIGYRTVPVDLLAAAHKTPEHLARNPQGKVPVLDIDGHVLTQSLAIIEYLHETRAGSSLLPADALGRQRVRALSDAIAMDIHPICNTGTINHVMELTGGGNDVRVAWMRKFIGEGLAAFEQIARRPGDWNILPRRPADTGRHLPGAAGLQCRPLGRRHFGLSRASSTLSRPVRRCPRSRRRSQKSRKRNVNGLAPLPAFRFKLRHDPSPLIAIDGPAASGKGTLARRLADFYHLPHLDTGLTYRAVAHRMLQLGLPLDDEAHAVQAAGDVDLANLDKHALSAHAVGDAASKVAVISEVRRILVDKQREFAAQPGGAVLDGRDIGTVVCPDADVKLYVTASAEVRGSAACATSKTVAAQPDVADILADIRRRDERDMGRADSPLRPATDAHLLDTTEMSIEAAFRAARSIVDDILAERNKA
jgi:cytidylate kinase